MRMLANLLWHLWVFVQSKIEIPGLDEQRRYAHKPHYIKYE